MNTATFDTHAAVKPLTRAGVATEHAEAIADTVRVAVSEGVATKTDIAALDANRRTQGGPLPRLVDTGRRRRRPRRAGRPGGRAPSGGRGCGGEFHRPAPDRGNRVRPGLQAAPRRAIVAA